MSAPRYHYYFNVRAALALTVIGLAMAIGLYYLWGYQETRLLRIALKQVEGFRDAAEGEESAEQRSRDYDLALRHLNQYLAYRPDDPDALEIQAKLLEKGINNPNDLLNPTAVYEHLLRIEPDGPRAQEARRRLADLYIRHSDFARADAAFARFRPVSPQDIGQQLKYYPAELRLDQLLDPRAVPRVDDAEAHRLRGMALEGQIVRLKEGQIAQSRPVLVEVAGKKVPKMVTVDGRQVEEKVDLTELAISEYRAALERDPGDLIAAQRQANLLFNHKKDPEAARRVLDDLLKARPDSLEVRLIRHEFAKAFRDNRAVTEEIEAAAKIAPDNIAVIVKAAEDALKAGPGGTAEARRWIDKVPEHARNQVPVLAMRGTIALAEGKSAEAVELWQKALEESKGSDAELSWRMAYLLLELRRDDEASKHVSQYQRLAGDKSPFFQVLAAIQSERKGKFGDAINLLEMARDRVPPDLQEIVRGALGRCQQAQGDRLAAERTFREGIELQPGSAKLRQALASLLMDARPEDAEREVVEALGSFPNDPTLLVLLARARFLKQMSRPPAGRNWNDFDAAFTRAAEVSPRAPALAMMRADRLASDGGIDPAIAYLKEVVAKDPTNTQVVIALAEGLSKQGRADEALQALDRASAPGAVGDRAPIRIERARLLTAMGRGREAREQLIRDVDALPAVDQSEVRRAFGLLSVSQGDRGASRDALAEWSRMLPDDPTPKFALLELSIEANDEAAIRAQIDSLRRHAEKDEPVWRLAQARERLWQRSRPDRSKKDQAALLQEAADLVESVLRDHKAHPTATWLRAIVQEERGELEQAANSYLQVWTSQGNSTALARLIELLTRLGRKDRLAELRRSDTTNLIAQFEAHAFLRAGDKAEAARVVEESLQAQAGAPTWQVAMLDLLGDDAKAEAALRAKAEQQSELEPWLVLIRYQASHGLSQSLPQSIAQAKKSVKTDRPNLLEAQCLWAAADQSAAEKAFEKAIGLAPDDRDVQLIASQFFQEIGRMDIAEECLRRILTINPEDRPVTRQLALVLSVRDDRPDWKRAIELLGPEDPANDTNEERLTRAVVLMRSEDPALWKQAMERLDSLIADLPTDNTVATTARELLTRLLIAKGQFDQARRVAAISAKSGANPTAIALYAETLFQTNETAALEEQLRRLMTSAQGMAYEANLRARLIKKQAEPGRAAGLLEEAYGAREDTPGAERFGREAFQMLIEMGPEAIGNAERLGRRLASKNPALSWMPAWVLHRKDASEEALALCERSIQANQVPTDLVNTCRIVVETAVASRGNPKVIEKADELLATAILRTPVPDDLLVMKAMIAHLRQDYEEEVRLYKVILAHKPLNPVVTNNIAWTLSEGLKQPNEGLEVIDKLIKVAGRDPECLDTRGMILMRLGRYKEAFDDLQEAVKAAPTGTRQFHLALACKKLGKHDEARKAIEEALKAGLTPATVEPIERADFEALTKL